MRQSTFIFFLIFSLSTFGAFAAMAKHDYGFVILSFGCLLFSIAFIVELGRVQKISINKFHKITAVVELVCLAGISALFFCKIFLYLFIGMDRMYLLFVIVLIVTSIIRITRGSKFSDPSNRNDFLTRTSIFSALLIFLISDAYSKVFYEDLTYFLFAGMVVAAGGCIFGVLRNAINIRENKPVWLLFGYMLVASYSLMVQFKMTDEVRFRRMPAEYVKLFYDAESGREKPVNGRYQFELYLEGRDKFIEAYQQRGN